jgi:hypothetical protein
VSPQSSNQAIQATVLCQRHSRLPCCMTLKLTAQLQRMQLPVTVHAWTRSRQCQSLSSGPQHSRILVSLLLTPTATCSSHPTPRAIPSWGARFSLRGAHALVLQVKQQTHSCTYGSLHAAGACFHPLGATNGSNELVLRIFRRRQRSEAQCEMVARQGRVKRALIALGQLLQSDPPAACLHWDPAAEASEIVQQP